MEQQENRDLEQEALDFKALHPEVDQLTDEVTQAWAGGVPLIEAWEAQQQRQTRQAEREAEQKAREERIRQQNQETEARAPVAGVTGQGSVKDAPRDDFIAGLEQDGW